MNEKEQLKQAKDQLKESIKVVHRDLKIYGKAVINRNKAVLKRVGNNAVELFKKFTEVTRLSSLNNKKIELQEELLKIEEQIRFFQERTEKKDKINSSSNRILNFKNNIKQKTSSIKSKFGKVKNSFLRKLNLSNIDVKLRNAFDKVQIWGLTALNKGAETANKVKDGISNFTSDQIANYYNWKSKRQEKTEQRQHELRLMEADEMAEEQIKERTENHRQGMIEAFEEQENNVQEEIASDVQDIMENLDEEERKLNLNSDDKQKTSSLKSRLGRVKNSVLRNLNMANIDVKIRNAFDHVQIWGLTALGAGVSVANKAKDSVVNFTSDQIAKYSEWRLNKQLEKERNERMSLDDEMSKQQIKERTKEHKSGMIEAFNKQERDQYDVKHEELINRKQELIKNLIAEKNRLINKQHSVYDEVYEETEVKVNHR